MTVDGSTGLLKSVTNLKNSVTALVQQSLLYYKSFKGNTTSDKTQASGAYVFRPNGSDPVVIGDNVKVQVIKVRPSVGEHFQVYCFGQLVFF